MLEAFCTASFVELAKEVRHDLPFHNMFAVIFVRAVKNLVRSALPLIITVVVLLFEAIRLYVFLVFVNQFSAFMLVRTYVKLTVTGVIVGSELKNSIP